MNPHVDIYDQNTGRPITLAPQHIVSIWSEGRGAGVSIAVSNGKTYRVNETLDAAKEMFWPEMKGKPPKGKPL